MKYIGKERIYMKKTLFSIIVVLLLTTLVACGQKEEPLNIANPWLDHKTLGEACCAVNFNMTAPEHIEGYGDPIYRTLNNEIIEVLFRNHDDEICIRKYAGREDRDRDFGGHESYPYGGYATEVSNCYHELGTEPGTINLVSWGEGDYSFIFFCENGFTDSEALFDIVHQVK